jgi:sec-independent protein translocase protein TatC
VAKNDVEMSLGDHLVELRKRLVRGLLGVLLATSVSALYYEEIMVALLSPYMKAAKEAQERAGPVTPVAPEGEGAEAVPVSAPLSAVAAPQPPRIIMGSPITGIMAIIIVTTVVGVFLASPWVVYQLWSFVSVGLRVQERRYVQIYAPISFLLFVGGGAVFYFAILPTGLAFLMSSAQSVRFEGVPLIDPSVLLGDYLKFIALMTVIFGIMFETPLVVIFLARSGIVSLQTLARKQKLIIFIMIVLGAVIAPTGDPISCAVMAGILVVLYEVGLLFAWLGDRRRRRQKAAEEAAEKQAGGEEPRD